MNATLAADAATGAAGLVDRLVRLDAERLDHRLELLKLRQALRALPAAISDEAEAEPAYPWPLALDRDTALGLYDHRVDDEALREADRGVAFLWRFSLLGSAPQCAAAVHWLNQQPRTLVSTTPAISIVIPVYGQLGYTLNCIDSLFALQGRAKADIIVVDDASPDGSADVLAQLRGISLIRQRVNGGFIASCNAGASQARGRFVLFLNNDTRVLPGWLDALVDHVAQFPKTGLVGSKMLYPDGSLQEAGGIIWRDGSCWNVGRNDDPNRPHYCFARRVDYVSGCSIMLPTHLFHALGGFDRHYAPAYCEDADVALRVSAAGHEVWFQPQSRVLHYEGRSCGTDEATGVKAYQRLNSRKLYLRWHARLATHRPNGKQPRLERERHVARKALVIDATTPTPRQDAGSVTTSLTLGLFQPLGYKAHFVPQDNFLYQPEHSVDLLRAGIEVAYAPYESDFESYMRRHGAGFDVVLIYRVTVMAQVIEAVRRLAPQAVVLFHTMDLHFLRLQRHAALSHDAAAMAAAAAMKQQELALIHAADCTITHSTYEQALLAEAAPCDEVVVWPFMFDFHGTQRGFGERRDFCFLGGYLHAPNIDAVLFFAREVLPLIHRTAPSARFIIAGANPTPEVLALAGPHIIVTGQIDDLRDVFDQARVFVCSLRVGAGTKGKVSTAMSYGLPVVSTSCGAEGMELVDGVDVLLADSAEDFAAACLRCHNDPVVWNSLSLAGQNLVRDKHSRTMGERVLGEAIEIGLRHKLGLSQKAMAQP